MPPPPIPPSRPRIGIDTGGTFTDLIALSPAGDLLVHKLRSTPEDPSKAILTGLQTLAAEHPEITHGSTVATNALLERRGAPCALITTAGFEDVLLIGRQTRTRLYDFLVESPRPLIPLGLTFGVKERTLYTGAILTPLDPAEVTALLPRLRALGVTSVAVCLLHSYANPAHEQLIAATLRAAGLTVSASYEILPEYREFERFSTTVVNAYVTPLMCSYLTNLEQALGPQLTTDNGELTTSPPLRIMQSNGGSISAATARREAVQTILSGPAAGVVGAQAIAAASGHTRLITFDMGGTSTDVSLIDGLIGTTNDSLVGDLPIRLPVLDIHTVGAGGGSIAAIDSGGSLRVGPRSAGANPGPVCYGIGSDLTVTDANLLLGRLDPTFFLGGRMSLDLPRTHAAAATLAARLGLSVPALAEGIIRIANSNMERAIRVVSVQRGHDPRDFALLAFGGAGGLHACALASSLGIRTVLIPQHSGVLSALGMLLADVIKTYSASILQPTTPSLYALLQTRLAPLTSRALTDLAAEGFSPLAITLTPTVDMRYRGQSYEISIPLPLDESGPNFEQAFHTAHAKLYGYSNPTRPTEVVQLRLRATGLTTKPALTPTSPTPSPQLPPTPTATRPVLFDAHPHPTPIFHREHLLTGTQAQGPALILTAQSTNVIPPLWHWQIDPAGTLVATHHQVSGAFQPIPLS